jgi:hypothetical protein
MMPNNLENIKINNVNDLQIDKFVDLILESVIEEIASIKNKINYTIYYLHTVNFFSNLENINCRHIIPESDNYCDTLIFNKYKAEQIPQLFYF